MKSKIYTAQVIEIIEKQGEPTLELRIRIPILHGTDKASRIRTEDLPIAKPLLLPGVAVDINKFKELAKENSLVQVKIYGNLEEIYYLGFVADSGVIREINTIGDFNVLDGGVF